MIVKVFNRYESTHVEEAQSLDDAKREMKAASDNGSIFAIGIYDDETRTAYIDGPHAIGFTLEDAINIIRAEAGPVDLRTFSAGPTQAGQALDALCEGRLRRSSSA